MAPRTHVSPSPSEDAALWSLALASSGAQLPPTQRDALQDGTACVAITPSAVRVTARASSLATWIQDGSLRGCADAVRRITDGTRELAILPVDDAAPITRDPIHSFERFLVGPSNRELRDLAWRFASLPSAFGGCLLLHGPRGAGKSHLLACLAHRFSEKSDPGSVVSRTASELSLDLVAAIWQGSLESFRERIRTPSALLVDDIHALAGREATQEELATTLDALNAAGVPVALTAPRPAADLRELIEPLRIRLAKAHPVELAPPEWETRVAIVLDRIRRWGVEASPDVASLLASTLHEDLDRLDARITQVLLRAPSTGRLSDMGRVRSALVDPPQSSVRTTPDEVISVVCRHFHLRRRDLRSSSRSPRLVLPRQVAIYLIRRLCGLSYPEIGRRFDRHHTTALHADRLVKQRLDGDAGLRTLVSLLEKEFGPFPKDGG